MSKTFEFFEKYGIIDFVQRMVNVMPRVMIDKDPCAVEKFIPVAIEQEFLEKTTKNKSIGEFIKAVVADVVAEADIKKTNLNGSPLMDMLFRDLDYLFPKKDDENKEKAE